MTALLPPSFEKQLLRAREDRGPRSSKSTTLDASMAHPDTDADAGGTETLQASRVSPRRLL